MLTRLTWALLAASTLPALAQTPATGHYQFCNLVGGGMPSRNAYLDYGQNTKAHILKADADPAYSQAAPAVPYANAELNALNAEVQKLNSTVLALNYLVGRGWECFAVTSLSPGGLIYVLRRPVP